MAVPRPTPARRVTVRELAAALGAPEPAVDAALTGVTLDSRRVHPGDLYAALPGARFHGADFAGQAAASGAVAVLTDAAGAGRVADQGGQGASLPALVVPDPRAVLGRASALVYGTTSLPFPLVGITGTNGKTTTAHLVASAFEALGRVTGLIGTVEMRVGPERVSSARTTPEAPDLHGLLALMAERGIEAAVMEVSSHALALHRVDGVVYDLALFTNLSQDHLDFHAGLEDYFAAKADLFTPDRSRRGLVCVDDAWGRRLAETATVPVQTLGRSPDADWVITPQTGPEAGPEAFRLRGSTPTESIDLSLRSRLPGSFNVTNTAMAAATLLLLGVPAAQAAEAVLGDPHVPGRMEVVTVPGGEGRLPRVVVDYAHTPDAIAAALAALRPTTEGPLICVTGAGGDRDREKRDDMGAAAAGLTEIVVVTDDNPRSEDPAAIRAAVRSGADLVAQARAGAVQVLEEGDRRQAIRRAVRLAAETGPEATVAIVGKGHESGQEIQGVVHPFLDRDEAAAALRAVLEELDA